MRLGLCFCGQENMRTRGWACVFVDKRTREHEDGLVVFFNENIKIK